jgi:hypothetical protein
MRSMVEGRVRQGPSVSGSTAATSPSLRDREERDAGHHHAASAIAS